MVPVSDVSPVILVSSGAPNPPVDCFSAPILCQHGDDECAGNNLEMCAVSLYPPTDSAAAAMSMAQFVYCFEIDNALNLAAAPGCAAYAGFDISALMTCFNDSARVQQLQQQFAAETAALGVAKLGVPWVLVNNATLDDTTQFLQAVCAAWTGAKPAGCP